MLPLGTLLMHSFWKKLSCPAPFSGIPNFSALRKACDSLGEHQCWLVCICQAWYNLEGRLCVAGQGGAKEWLVAQIQGGLGAMSLDLFTNLVYSLLCFNFLLWKIRITRFDLLVSGKVWGSNEIIDENVFGKHKGFHIYGRDGFVVEGKLLHVHPLTDDEAVLLLALHHRPT